MTSISSALRMNNNSLTLNLGSACNNNCIFCVRGGNPYIASVDVHVVSSILYKFRDKYRALKITGGEPAQHKDIIPILALAHKLKYSISIETNGRMSADMGWVQAIAPFKPAIVTHVESHVPLKHDIITRAPGSFLQTVAGIRNQINAGLSTSVKIMILEYNYRDLLPIARLLAKLQVDQVMFVFLDPGGFAEKFINTIMPRYDKVRLCVSKAATWLQGNTAVTIKFENFPGCCLDPEFWKFENQKICKGEGLAIGTRPQTEKVDWYASTAERRKKKVKNSFCRGCLCHDTCEGVYTKYVDRFGWEEFEPVF